MPTPFFAHVAAHAQRSIVEVVPVEDVVTLLTSLLNSGVGTAQQIAEFVPVGGGNLQGSTGIFKAVGGTAANGAAFIKAAGKRLPVVGDFLSSDTMSALHDFKTGPPPTLAPFEAPEDAARLASMAGAAGELAKNTAMAVAAMPAAAVAHGANTVGAAFNAMSDNLMAKPEEMNQLLQFHHSLWGNFLAGAEAADSTLPTENLSNEIKGLAQIHPQLTSLLDQFNNPAALPVLGSLEKVFGVVKVKGAVEDAESPSVLSPTGMKLALANIALNFIDSVSSAL